MTNLQDLKPGEWVYLPDYNDDGPAQVVYEVGHGPIAEVQPYRDRSPESMERGRIMAAGKNLLIACETLLKKVEDVNDVQWDGTGYDESYQSSELRVALDLARAAIAKAKGNIQTE